MNKLVIPGIYRHFKHDEKAENKLNYTYVTIAESEPLDLIDILQSHKVCLDKVHKVKFTETNEFMPIYEIGDRFFHNKAVYDGHFVVYKSLYDSFGVYARPKDMFLDDGAVGRVDNKTGQKHRMELIGGIYNVSGAVEGH